MVTRLTAPHIPSRGPACLVRKRRKASSAWIRVLVSPRMDAFEPCLLSSLFVSLFCFGSDASAALVSVRVSYESPSAEQKRRKIGILLGASCPSRCSLSFYQAFRYLVAFLSIPTSKRNEETAILSALKFPGGHSQVHLFTPEICEGSAMERGAFIPHKDPREKDLTKRDDVVRG